MTPALASLANTREMIDIKELRIGSLISGPEKVAGILPPSFSSYSRFSDKYLIDVFDGATNSHIPLDEVEPIPLTEEWLLKLGFKYRYHKKHGNGADWQPDYPFTEYKRYVRGDYSVTMENIRWKERRGDICIDDWETYIEHEGGSLYPPIDYVHQLQNIFFALTGEELEIKPEAENEEQI